MRRTQRPGGARRARAGRGARALTGAAFTFATLDGASLAGPSLDGPSLDGPSHDGTALAGHLLEPAVADLVATGQRMRAVDLGAAVIALRDLAAALVDDLAEVDVLLTPTTASTAPDLGVVGTDRPAAALFAEIFRRSPFLAAFNVIGGPALSLPWAHDDGGAGIGVHLAGVQGTDDLVLGLAAALEPLAPAARA